jgi:hypothetical protein
VNPLKLQSKKGKAPGRPTCPTCGQHLPRPACTCGHTEASHDLRGTTRTRCSAHTGPKGVPCPCAGWQPQAVTG